MAAVGGRRRGPPWMSGLTETDYTHTRAHSRSRLINSPDKHVFGRREGARVPEEKPGKHRKNRQAREAGAEVRAPNCDSATHGTTVPPFSQMICQANIFIILPAL